MSMRDYAVSDYGLILDDNTMKVLAKAICEDFSEEEFEIDKYEFYEAVVDKLCIYYSNFTGEATCLSDTGEDDWSQNTISYYDESVYMIPLINSPTLFKPAYTCMDEIIEEMKTVAGAYLPEDFDYRGNIRHLTGTYYG